jgi:hypothetical protein
MNGPDLFPEQQNLLAVSTRTIHEAEQRIDSCEQCNPADAEIPFDWILDRVTGSDSTITDYVIESPAQCPKCRGKIFEKTLIEPAD